MVKRLLPLFLGMVMFHLSAFAQNSYTLLSPDGTIQMDIEVGNEISYSLAVAGETLISKASIGYEINSSPLNFATIKEKNTRRIENEIHPPIKGNGAVISDTYNELSLEFSGNFLVHFRAYNDGVAHRLETKLPGEIIISDETFDLEFPDNSETWFPQVEDFFDSNETNFTHAKLDTFPSQTLGFLPVLFSNQQGQKVIVMESSLHDYAGMWLYSTPKGMSAVFPRYPDEVENRGDRQQVVITRKSYIAKTTGTRTFPWRILGVAKQDKELLSNNLVYALAEETAIETDWIKPGKVAWDWWNALNIRHVDFKSGPNTDTYKYYIDFAAENGIEYVILDEGWYILGDLLHLNDEINVKELIKYGEKKGVGIILWVVWRTLDEQFEEAMDAFAQWGAKGIKVDFMDRDDQWMVNYYERVAKAAADRELLVDFHGAYKPSGLRRKYPNVITREGVLGLEYNKWSDDVTPTHNLTIPFTRMVPGPIDYTPGGMTNTQPGNFRVSHFRPMVMGTRAHEVAKFVIFESPLQMMADTPTNYMDEQETTDFIAGIPSTWDEVIPLEGAVGEFIAVAKSHENKWYIAAMTNENRRSFALKLDFLGKGNYLATIFKDGINAEMHAEDYKLETKKVRNGDILNIDLAPSGGWAAIISEQ